ncbi:MAG: cation transporter [Candidatus Nealsonbacteria bacterium CG_4_9_14_0_2_um_filter_37_38]|nr:MAG: cation-efflux pump [Candidatus Nealsonbacteria bacterium CG11_big_fil_rev_8_21_14_0_20_37_68]PIW91852.1 MAG: cation transporter [Candidatus Nealsonbacteria bacterium CG_4_8_14_3_um_filter_37_23]PJC51717.1 MAG: cation transporter [Candidatus Nealsonbacteria bacterium CG_4_9_14_0_2_um_filter_37_38]
MNYSEIKKVLIKILFLNWLVAFAKIFIGLFSGALSILADGIHSFFDGASNIIGLIGVKISARPKDENHPYGHQKYEALASLGILFLLIIIVYEICKEIIQRFLNPTIPQITILVFGVLIGSLIIDYFVARYEYSRAKTLKSIILKADSFHTKSHIFTTGGVILGAIAIRAGFPMADPLLAIFVVGFIIKMATEVFRESSKILCDVAFIAPEKIKKIASEIDGIESTHQIRTRGLEGHIFLDMHIVISPEFPLEKAHQISHQVKERLQKEIPEIKDITIHIEPEDKSKICACDS